MNFLKNLKLSLPVFLCFMVAFWLDWRPIKPVSKKKLVKIELKNPRYNKAELKDHASEFILYSRYSGYLMEDFNEHLRNAKLLQVKSGFMENFKLEVETYTENARILYQLTKLYPSFNNWSIRVITPGVDIATVTPKQPRPEKKKPAKKKAKPARAAKPKKAKSAKPAKPKPAPKKKAAKKPATKKTKKKSRR
ncbi:MAG: hypothetical protein HZA04_08880 [Nitrospinae bacterium]|nr:hypothetical protein [Nitrospinota bacterium]